eukprot:1148577-Pelagomonas_calceolata.AAC.3
MPQQVSWEVPHARQAICSILCLLHTLFVSVHPCTACWLSLAIQHNPCTMPLSAANHKEAYKELMAAVGVGHGLANLASQPVPGAHDCLADHAAKLHFDKGTSKNITATHAAATSGLLPRGQPLPEVRDLLLARPLPPAARPNQPPGESHVDKLLTFLGCRSKPGPTRP